jgi:hypothetical protein
MENRPSASDVRATRRAVEAWRSTCQGQHGRIPEALWARAVECALRHGVETVAMQLGIRPGTLLRRVEAQKGRTESEKPVFIELGMPSSSPQGCEIELERADGAKLSIHVQGQCPDLQALLSAFLSRSS